MLEHIAGSVVEPLPRRLASSDGQRSVQDAITYALGSPTSVPTTLTRQMP
jgi:hypothetical protein